MNFLKKTVENLLVWQARQVLKKYKPGIIAITGSVGKTSTKDAIYAAIAGAASGGAAATGAAIDGKTLSVRKSDKSFNSDIGVALTVLGVPNGWYNPFRWLANFAEGFLLLIFTFHYPRWLVLEVGADRPGDIERVSQWIKPDVAVLTRFADVPVHIEFFPSVEALVSEKGRLVAALKPEGTLVLNADDERVMSFADSVASKKISYGFGGSAMVRVSYDEVFYEPLEQSEVALPAGIRFRLDYNGSSIPVSAHGVLGRQHIYPLAAGFAVAAALGINPVAASGGLQAYVPPAGRMHLLTGIKDSLIIDDTYNASPVAVEEGLRVLDSLKAPGRKIAVIGDMMELGDYSVEQHRKVGELVAKMTKNQGDSRDGSQSSQKVLLVCVGVRMRGAADSALDAGMDELAILQFDDSSEAGRYLAEHLEQNDIIFIKGSQSMRMERVVLELMEHREQAAELLVRQDSAWRRK